MKPEKITDIDWKLLQEKYPDIDEIKEKIEQNYPVQYLIGNVNFCDALIEVNEHVLIPRFETEYLVEKVIKKLENKPDNSLKILDLGTGSGCIIISLAKKLNQKFTAIDISSKALEVAKSNANLNKVEIEFKKLDILNEKLKEDYDVIISNPPYVAFDESVGPETKFEPQSAIFANNNGLEFYERIVNIISNQPILIAFEIGMNQAEEIIKFAKTKFPDAKITTEKDLTGRNRYIFIEHK